MAKNGKKSFLDYFKINDSSDEYEDDLFDDDSSSQKDETAKKEEVDNTKLSQTLENSNTTNNDMISLGNLESAEKSQKASIITDEEDSYDLQKELEAKFDELFGPIDDDN